MDVFDIFLLEAVVNGILLGGLLALLSLGLNLIFGVIDVVWICYAELIMIGMYAVFVLHTQHGWPLLAAMPAGIAIVAALGAALHQFVIRPVLAAEPINQLLVTGGMLFLLQAVATLAFGIDFRNLGVRMQPIVVGEMSISAPRVIAFVAALGGVGATWLLLSRTYIGTAIRAISQDRAIMPLMGVNSDRVFVITSALCSSRSATSSCCAGVRTSLEFASCVKRSDSEASMIAPAKARPKDSPKDPPAELTPAASLTRSSSIGDSV